MTPSFRSLRLIVIGRPARANMLARNMAADGLRDADQRRVYVDAGRLSARPVIVGGGQAIGWRGVVTLLHDWTSQAMEDCRCPAGKRQDRRPSD